MHKAIFTYEMIETNGKKGIAITDLNGAVSITNDIKNVVDSIAAMESIDPADFIIVYRDSMGNWDGWDHKKQDFVLMGAKHWAHAINKYAKMERENNSESLKNLSVFR